MLSALGKSLAVSLKAICYEVMTLKGGEKKPSWTSPLISVFGLAISSGSLMLPFMSTVEHKSTRKTPLSTANESHKNSSINLRVISPRDTSE